MKDVPAELIRFISEGNEFIIAGHKEPDGDCIGSQLALASVLERLGKKAFPCTAGPFKRTEIQAYESRFVSCPPKTAGMRAIIMDCSLPERLGDLSKDIEGLPLASIDHHASGNPSGDVVYLDPDAPSVCVMALKLIEALGLVPVKEEAELLFLGLCADTGFFRHVDEHGAETFRMAAKLIEAGANPKKTFQTLNGGKSLLSRNLTGLVLSRTRPLFDGRLLLSFEEYEDARRFGGESRDSDMIYQLLMSVKGAEAAALVRQEQPDNCTLGFRSKDAVNVAAIAKLFGGGGHKNAAGASVKGTIAEIEPRLIDAFKKIFSP